MPSSYVQFVVRCAGPNCNHIKGENNHWFICHVTDRFLIKPWDDEAVLTEDNVLPLCGDSCVTKMLSVYLTGRTKGGSHDGA